MISWWKHMETFKLRILPACLSLLLCLVSIFPVQASEALKFGVLNQHPVTITAQIWNPILQYVSQRTGVPLALAMGRTAPETTRRTLAGEYDFAYTNHLFTPERQQLGFRVIARLNRPTISSQIVVAIDSPLQTLDDLEGKRVAFPSREAFVGYHVPHQALKQSGIGVTARFAGNQEGAMQQLAAGAVDAAAVNDRVMDAFASRLGFRYRVLWRSEPYPDLAVMVHPRLPADLVEQIRSTLVGMHEEPAGRSALESANAIAKNPQPLAFVPATDADYIPYSRFWLKQGGQP